jgi:drug/metabolite transporter (DMT)-like permease
VEHASTAVCAILIEFAVARRRAGPRPPREWWPRPRQFPGLALVALAGVAGDLAYASASRHGALSVVSAVSSLYPVATIALGVCVQRLRPGRIQVAGVILALIGGAVLGAATA